MAKQLAHPGRPNYAAPAAPHQLSVFSSKLLDGGEIEVGGQIYGATDGLVGVESMPGVLIYNAPGLETDALFVEASTGRVTAFRYKAKGSQWFHATANFLKSLEAPTAVPAPAGRRRRLAHNLFSRLADRIRWIDAEYHPYQRLFALADDGTVTLATGGQLAPGNAPVTLSTGQMLAINGLDATLHAENGDVVERFRRPAGKHRWRRLVTVRPERPDVLGFPCRLSDRGDLVVLPEGLPPYAIAAGKQFSLHLSDGRSLTRPAGGGQLFAVDQTGAVQEFLIGPRGRLERLTGARDEWVYTMLGCPGEGEHPRRFVEIMLGAITLHDCGTVVILGRAYLVAEEVSVRTAALRVERAAGVVQLLYVRTPASVIGYVFGLDGQWWLGTPRTPDRCYFSVRRFGEAENLVTFAFQGIEVFVSKSPGMARIDQLLAAVGRTAEGFAAQPLLLPFGFLVAIVLTMGLLAGFLASRVLGLIWGALWRAYRHVRRAWELST